MNVNRQTILESVHRQLRESLAETGEVRPLGEIVPRVAGEIRSQSASATTNSTGIIPVEKVAAFVDGHLQSEEAEAICDAVMVDNSVLAEIIAAVRATQVSCEQLPPLPASLSAQLTAISSVVSATSQTDAYADDEDLGEIRGQTKPAPMSHGVLRKTEPTALAAGVSSPRDAGTRPEASAYGSRKEASSSARSDAVSSHRSSGLRIAVGLLAIAATIVAAIALLGRRRDKAPDQTTVVESGVDKGGEQPDPQPLGIPDVFPEPERVPRDLIQSIVENEPPASQSKQDDLGRENPPMDPAAAKVIQESESIPEEAVVEKTPQPTPESEPPIDPGPARITDPPRLADLRWVEVSGVLARRNEPTEESGSRRAPTWSRIQEGASSSATSAGQTRRVALRTLPLSRAKGQLEDGGRFVIAGDSGLQITRGTTEVLAELDLMYGSVALIGLSEGTVVKMQRGNQTIATLRWQSKASAVVNRLTTGLQIQVNRGEIEINDTPVKEKSVQVAHDQSMESVPAPKRLPRWVTRPEETNGVERMILAQIADTSDLTASLNQKIAALASSPTLSRDESHALAKLASWQAAMAGPNLIRLAVSRVPALRLAAMQRLTQLSESDPRYPRIWNAIDRSVNNAQRTAQIREWFRLIRTGSRPSAAQLEQMLGGLSSQNMSGRAISDFILRQYVRNPPPFDPSWTGQTLQRAVNIYRQRAGVPVDRLRAGAAATVVP
jgi:hypothetical protein